MRDNSCPMCSEPITGPAYLVDGARKYGRRWTAARLTICSPCYARGGPDPDTGLSRPDTLRTSPRCRWFTLAGRGELLPPIPCTVCGRMVVRNGDPLLKRVTCSHSCATALTRTRNGGKGSGKPCETCGQPVTTGRSDSRYCGSACRQKAYRRRATDSHA